MSWERHQPPPPALIYAVLPDCQLCSWCWDHTEHAFKLKVRSALCQVHQPGQAA